MIEGATRGDTCPEQGLLRLLISFSCLPSKGCTQGYTCDDRLAAECIGGMGSGYRTKDISRRVRHSIRACPSGIVVATSGVQQLRNERAKPKDDSSTPGVKAPSNGLGITSRARIGQGRSPPSASTCHTNTYPQELPLQYHLRTAISLFSVYLKYTRHVPPRNHKSSV